MNFGIDMIYEEKTMLLELPVVKDYRGDLTAIEGQLDVPFDIARVYYLYNVPNNSKRGGHAHKNLEQLIIALSGSFRITTESAKEKKTHWLSNPSQGLYLRNLVWREIDCFSQGAVCMVIASMPYDESDYIRNKNTFKKMVLQD